MDKPLLIFGSEYVYKLLLMVTNVQATTLLAAAVLVLLLLSFFISGAEMAFFSLTYRDINMLKTKQDPGWKRIASLLEEPRALQASLMIANTLVNIAVIILTNFFIDQVLVIKPGNVSMWVGYGIKLVIISSLIILFGEILPKVRSSQNNLRAAYEASFLVEVIFYLFKRISVWLLKVSDSVESLFGGKASRAYTHQQLEQAIKNTIHEEEEQRILAGIYKFPNITVKQIMHTRLDVNGIEYEASFQSLKRKVEELHYSRLPVYRKSLDDILGIVHTKDLLPHLNESDNFDWHIVIRPPFFVHEQKHIEDLLKEFQSRHIHFAVVVDEFGGTSGIVTLEDILEEIIGDIRDEFDEEETGSKKIDDKTYIFEGRTMIHDACKLMNLQEDTFDQVKGDSDSMAGLMLELVGEIPKVNDTASIGDFDFVALEVDRNRIRKIKVTINIKQDKQVS
ncbi:gliding motility-associated protein GldE [Niastella caeni]|uniref:Gliding motility-associated protein GldE n=1 Tax=Niastella caeni TaxID=2569763 RepID=A0A4S8HP60_9BACT|nr:gliding motility-associated protein GldE [Niastella caeni]THU37180.1 gliding motility-associated protein GldE [Niastella caeni]